MGIRVALHHKTVYEYDRLVTLSPQVVRLRPAPHSRTHISSYSLRVQPEEHFINWQQDPQGNFLARLVFQNPTRFFSVEVDLVAEMAVLNPFDFFLEPEYEKFPFRYGSGDRHELGLFLEAPPPGPRLKAFLATVDRREMRTIDFLVNLNAQLNREIRYVVRMEPGVQTSEETLKLASGSCRDSAWLLVQVLRQLGLAARFVSGYLIQLKPDVKPLEGPVGPSEDFTDLHAWAEVYLPGAGWIGLDPTSGLFAGEGHIPLAGTPEPGSAAPVTGLVSPCEVEFQHEMKVTRIHEDPRVTKPYTDEEWQRIYELGERIDADLTAGDVRLTMGGEPTFVSVDDMDGDEWNTEAMGPNKRRLADDLLVRLRDKFAPGALLHFGQGKWYPGESLPRWALTCYWRSDGFALWRDPQWQASPDRNYGYGREEALQFAEALSERLKVDSEAVVAAYEDPLAFLLKERQLPVNVDPVENKLESAEERERLRRVFERGLGNPVGFVLPLQRGWGKNGPEWQTSLWMLRARHIFLIPGDSPVGFRLPLESLLWEPAGERQQPWQVDPLGPASPLPPPPKPFDSWVRGYGVQAQQRGRQSNSPYSYTQLGPVVRTALTVEARAGVLYLFLPPVNSAEDFVDLVASIEDTAAKLKMPVCIEGYPPPFDWRVRMLKVTPDPGVIEVNIQPSASWRELAENTTTLYEQARLSRLGTEKFMLDGRHTGTGGGNHMVLGGPTPADSPFLRRPDLLKSLVGYWLNHPSLSYLFSGTFIGPTSQAPRVDETRADAIYELEIAFNQLKDANPYGLPLWLVDRLFRNLLVDVTGNTHRAEFCIDKLYSPDSATGRLGLVELRAFEMPPHARMSLAQQLLLRALVARFWRSPYEETPIRWGTRLHDLFLLPYFVEKDFRWVISELQQAGYGFESEWFDPHKEFRFPVFGRVCYEGVEVELRQAIEPWNVLGEEPGTSGTTRFVDSSVERIQVRVRGLVSERYAVTCNGRRLPLHPTGTNGEFVCGVRYRAWQPPRCLHPTIPVHTPLVFDVVNLAAGRSVGGCTYHVAHPGGRSYDTIPVNSNEAEARRMARFFAFGHTPGSMVVPPIEENPEFPLTLDLRRAASAGVIR
ncbi:MAG: transglutaminase family protein [Candidatus Korobacteraceae bacterium]